MKKTISPVLKQFMNDVKTEIKKQKTSWFALSRILSGNRSHFQSWKSGKGSPTLKSMERVAEVLGKRLVIRLEDRE